MRDDDYPKPKHRVLTVWN